MSPQLIRTLIAGALFVHGVGHTLGFWMPTRSWVFGRFMGEPTLRVVSGVFWVVSAIGFVAARVAFLGILLPHEWWRSLALATAVVSLVGLVVFIGNWPAFNTIRAVGMNVAVLVALLWAK
jgi:cation transport ATPase